MNAKTLVLATLFLLGTIRGSSAATQCFARVAVPSLSDVPGGVLCVSVVPIGVSAYSALEPGCAKRYVIKPEDGANGNWGYLDFAECREGVCGASRQEQLECQLANGYACTSGGIGALVSTMTGARRGALRDGMQARFDADNDRRQNLCFDQYTGNGRRIVVLPLTTPPEKGKSEVRILAFAAFFLNALPADGSDAVEAEFLYLVIPGN